MPAKRARITDRDPLTPTDKVLAQYEQVNKSSSQLPESAGNETQPPKKSTSTQANKLASQQAKNSQITIQQPNKLTSEQANMTELDQSTSKEVSNIKGQEADQPASQPANQPTIRKATFQLDATVIENLDRYHLQLQIDLGKRNAPYKEIIVEEAIAQWLERATKSPDRVVKSLLKRQEQRSV